MYGYQSSLNYYHLKQPPLDYFIEEVEINYEKEMMCSDTLFSISIVFEKYLEVYTVNHKSL
jgi:hypothetical protein